MTPVQVRFVGSVVKATLSGRPSTVGVKVADILRAVVAIVDLLRSLVRIAHRITSGLLVVALA